PNGAPHQVSPGPEPLQLPALAANCKGSASSKPWPGALAIGGESRLNRVATGDAMASPDSQRTLKVAVAGLGIAGTGALRNLAKSSKTELIAACDIRPQAVRAFEAEYGGRGYESFADLCAAPD